MTKKYQEVPLKMVDPENELPTNLYLRINDKFIHYLNKGDAVSIPKYDLFLNKNVKSVFVEDQDYDLMMDWCLTVRHTFKEELTKGAEPEVKEMVDEAFEMEETLFDVFSDEELSEEKIGELKTYADSFVEKLKKQKTYQQALESLLKRNETLASHSSNVARLSIFIAMVSGIGSKFALENLFMAALFHDYGKVKIPPHILDNPSDPNFDKLMSEHPSNSLKVIKKSEGIPDSVTRMVSEHHEYWDGTGYPNGLKELEIYEYTYILSIANELDNFLYKNRTMPDVKKWERAIQMVEEGKETKFAPKLFPRIPDALKKTFLPKSY